MNEEERPNDHPNPSAPPPSEHGLQTAIDYMIERKIDALLWLTRIGTMVFTFLSLVPLFGVNPFTCYQRALMSNAATSALRLHQRMPPARFTREFVALLLIEDSCHYLLYSVLFIYSYPITLALLPIFLFAVLHSVTYSITILNKLGHYDTWSTRALMSIAQHHQRNILRFVALAEVILMPTTVLLALSGKGSLITSFTYYRFLSFRYASRRNPYTRTTFHEIRVILENFANAPGRNPSLKKLCHKLISSTSYLAPPVPPQ